MTRTKHTHRHTDETETDPTPLGGALSTWPAPSKRPVLRLKLALNTSGSVPLCTHNATWKPVGSGQLAWTLWLCVLWLRQDRDQSERLVMEGLCWWLRFGAE
eukprot:253304-Rhodomonas_salina.1